MRLTQCPRRPSTAGNACMRTPAQSRMGGGSNYNAGNSRPGQGQQSRLIIPGSDGAAPNQRPGGGLILPSQGGSAPSGGSLLGVDGGGGTAVRNFRPPPGFMDSAAAADGDSPPPPVTMPTDQILNRLSARAGRWHELAALLPALFNAGLDGPTIEELTGVERRLQNTWTGGSQVYRSLANSGEVAPEALAAFDGEDGAARLFELRFLSIKGQRPAAATYIAEQNLDGREAMVLARALKEHERREGHTEGFSSSPADCLAYKFYRDALECRKKEDAEVAVKRGLAVVETDAARDKLNSLLSGEHPGATLAMPTASLLVLRMEREEMGIRALALAGALQTATAAAVRAAPKASSEGVFGAFRLPEAGLASEWVALPGWSLLTLAVNPVGLVVKNCADVPAIRQASSAKTDEDAKRLTGPGLLVVDTGAEVASLEPEKFYLVEGAAGEALLADGAKAEGRSVLGAVLFLCRPPFRDTAAAETSELLSL